MAFNSNIMEESKEERIRRLIMEQRTCAQVNPVSDYAHRTAYAPNTFEPKRKTDDEIKISVLTEENEKLKKQYADLVKKANILVEAYRKLKAENEVLTKKKAKRDSVTEVFSSIGKSGGNIYQKFINWLKT